MLTFGMVIYNSEEIEKNTTNRGKEVGLKKGETQREKSELKQVTYLFMVR